MAETPTARLSAAAGEGLSARPCEGKLASARSGVAAVTVAALLVASVGLQLARDRRYQLAPVDAGILYIRSGTALARLALAYDALLADVYWIRAIQHYGGTKLSKDPEKRYDLLYPLLDITTTLDPRFNIAYRFGAIFLAEPFPNGPGRPDLAIRLLEKGIRAMPYKWQYFHDIGFIYYWWLHDYRSAADWLLRGSRIPGAPWWLRTLGATILAEGGERATSRVLWQQVYESAEHRWLREEARRRLAQLDALDVIDVLERLVGRYARTVGRFPTAWNDLVRAGLLHEVPLDPSGTPYLLGRVDGRVTVDPASPLAPLPTEPPRPQ